MGIIENLYFRSNHEQAFSTVLGTILNYDTSNVVLEKLLMLMAEKNKKVAPLVNEVLGWLKKKEEVEVNVTTETNINHGAQQVMNGYIDLLVEIKHPSNKPAYLLIENKIKADRFHGKQLERYLSYTQNGLNSGRTILAVLSVVDFNKLVNNTDLDNLRYDDSNETEKNKIAKHLVEGRKVVPLQWADLSSLLQTVKHESSTIARMVDDFIEDIKGVEMNFTGFKKIEHYTVSNFFELINDFYSFCEEVRSQTNGGKLISTSGDDMNDIRYFSGKEIKNMYMSPLDTYKSAWSYGFSFYLGNSKEGRYIQIDLSWLEKNNETHPVASLYLSDNGKFKGLLDNDVAYYDLATFINRFSEEDYQYELDKILSKIKNLLSV